MAEVVWRPQALRDLEAIDAYYEEVAPDFAALFVAGVFEATARLAEFPNAGRVVLEIADASVRELIHRQYRIIYVVVEGAAEGWTVYHSARPFGGLGRTRGRPGLSWRRGPLDGSGTGGPSPAAPVGGRGRR